MVDAYEILALAEAAEAESTGRGRPGQGQPAAAALGAVADDIPAAVAHLTATDRAAALRLVGALSAHWQDTGRVDEGRALSERVLAGGHKLAASDRRVAAAIPRALLAASELAFRQGDQKVARKRALDTIRAAVLIEDYVTAALAHANLARVAYRDGDAAEIEKRAKKALELGGDDTLARRGGLHMLAWAAHTAGDLDLAERRFEESLEYRRAVAGPISIASEIANLADLALERGNIKRAAVLHAEALEISREIDSVYMLVNMLPSIAALAAKAGRKEDAARLFGAADAVAADSGLIPDPGADMADARAEVRKSLGDDRFDGLVARGREVSQEDAVALAREIAADISRGALPDG